MAARLDVSAGIARRIRSGALVLLVSILASTASAYDQATHIVLSQQAYDSSIMNLYAFEYGMGAFGINNDGSVTFQKYPDTTGIDWDLYALVQVGSYYEDDGSRSLNHFFNPVNGLPLQVPLTTTYTSPDWALEDNPANGQVGVGQLSNQHTSYADARKYYWAALTASDPTVRSQNFGLMYQSLGQVIHHLEDMAQPQHARDEAHCCALSAFGLEFSFFHPSGYERYMLVCTYLAIGNSSPGDCPPLSGNYPAVFDQNNAETYGLFPLPRNFWTESGFGGNGGTPKYGIAEYSNAGFVGARTNFQGTPQALQPADPVNLPLPNGTGAQANSVNLADPSVFGPTFPIAATMTFISTPVNDQYLGTTSTNPKTSAYSIFTSDLTLGHFSPVFSVNEFTYASAGALLIPRAIGYSAGLLNYFFRGELGISLPTEGVYGIVDQSDQYSATSTTDVSGNTQGFHTIKVALTNASPDSEPMVDGTLVAILRYRRNNGYVDTLTGEAGAPGNGVLANARGTSDEYVVSATVKDASGNVLAPNSVELNSTPQQFEFDFPQALPLNSTDVYLQIAWQGTLGQEQNAVVSSTLDLSEPTYINIFNSLDYISVGGVFYTRDALDSNPQALALVQPQSCVVNNSLSPSCFPDTQPIPVYLDAHNTSENSQSLVVQQSLPVDAYVRVAVLTNAFGPNASAILNFASTCTGKTFTFSALNNEMAIISPASATNQDTLLESAYVSPLNSFRGILGWYNIYCVWEGDGAPNPSGDPTKMSAISGADIYPFPVTLNFPQLQQ